MDEKLFQKFMGIRFPHERDQAYIQEWRERFQGGNPENYMDSVSREAYRMAKKLLY